MFSWKVKKQNVLVQAKHVVLKTMSSGLSNLSILMIYALLGKKMVIHVLLKQSVTNVNQVMTLVKEKDSHSAMIELEMMLYVTRIRRI